MKPRLHKLPQHADSSFNISRAVHYHNNNEWHYHQELELIYVVSGQGTRFIGDKIEPIIEGELILIGANVPHMFRFDTYTYRNMMMQHGEIEIPTQMATLHFDPDMFGQFMMLPENKSISNLLRDALRSIEFYGTTKERVLSLMNHLMNASNMERMLLLMQLINVLANSSERLYITSANYTVVYNEQDDNRLTKIYLYTLNNFTRTIKLDEVAAIIYMVPNAFCRYFKSRTQKSYFTFLLEVRVSHACKLLAQNDFSMVIVSFECGFKNLSNFNRQFKEITGKTPLAYRKKFLSHTA